MKLESFSTKHELFLIVGVVMVVGTGIKLAGIMEFSSDWFWMVAGLGLVVEGLIMTGNRKKFDRKYKVVKKED